LYVGKDVRKIGSLKILLLLCNDFRFAIIVDDDDDDDAGDDIEAADIDDVDEADDDAITYL
jgi:hypothetical protein